MSTNIPSIQNQNTIPIHHGGGHGHGKKIANIQPVLEEALKETKSKPKKSLKSQMAEKLTIDPDAEHKQNNKQSKEQRAKKQLEEETVAEKPFGLDTLEFIGQVNMMGTYRKYGVKKFD